jgi:HK97 gp10 family phage protein
MSGLEEIAVNYKKQVDKNLSLDDHTLEQLRQMDYPYAVDKTTNVPHDDRLIHEQSGELRKSIKSSRPEQTTSRRFTVYVTTDSPYAPYLIYGTSRMRPRRFHEKSFNDIKDKYWDPVTSRLKKVNYRMTVGATTARQIG